MLMMLMRRLSLLLLVAIIVSVVCAARLKSIPMSSHDMSANGCAEHCLQTANLLPFSVPPQIYFPLLLAVALGILVVVEKKTAEPTTGKSEYGKIMQKQKLTTVILRN